MGEIEIISIARTAPRRTVGEVAAKIARKPSHTTGYLRSLGSAPVQRSIQEITAPSREVIEKPLTGRQQLGMLASSTEVELTPDITSIEEAVPRIHDLRTDTSNRDGVQEISQTAA